MLRIWRQWIKEQPNYSLTKNFITLNCYTCVDMNVHSIVRCIINLHAQNQPQLFMINLFDSQTCESTFRQLRSMSTTFSTIVNCSVFDFIHQLKKIQLQADIVHNNKDEIQFPRIAGKANFTSSILPSINEIIETINRAMSDAISDMSEVGIVIGETFNWKCNVIVAVSAIIDETIEDVIDEVDAIDAIDYRHLSAINDELELRDYSETNMVISEASPFTIVNIKNGNSKIVRKSSICWLLTKNKSYFSSDRLQRVKEQDVLRGAAGRSHTTKIDSNTSQFSVRQEVFIGEWVLFGCQGELLIGLVLSFVYLCGKTFREREYSLDYAPVIEFSQGLGIIFEPPTRRHATGQLLFFCVCPRCY